MAAGGARVYIVNEATSSAISLESEIARTYPNVLSLREDEPLLTVESTQAAISKSRYLFFAPTVRKTGQDIKTEIQSKFRDAVTPMKKGGSVVNHLPVGFGGSGEAISLLEMVSKGSARHARWIGGVIMCSPPPRPWLERSTHADREKTARSHQLKRTSYIVQF